MYKQLFLIGLFLSCAFNLKAQDTICSPKSVGEVLFKNKQKKQKVKNNSLVLLPVLGITPATGPFIGVGGLWGFYIDKKKINKLSSINFAAQVTTKGQYIFMVKENIYAFHNKIFLQGDYKYLIFSQPTYGLGTNAPDSSYLKYDFGINGFGSSKIPGAQMMYYNYLKLHQMLSYSVNDNNTFFIGGGFHIDNHSEIKDELYDINNTNQTSHSTYSKANGFELNNYRLIGVSANFVWDTRDNIINTYKGYYFNFNYRMNTTYLGSSKFSNMLWMEGRYFLPISKKSKRNVLAFWSYISSVVAGDVPYLDLPAIGYDQKGFSGRGYVQGRYRGNTLVYGEVEYRFRISKCTEVLGGVLFVNAVTTNDVANNVYLFEYIQPAAGAGLRIMIDKNVRTNIAVDYGHGNNSSGVYMTAGEIF